MARGGLLDPQRRAREKQASRDEDARRLAAGEITAADLARENDFFAGFDPSKARISAIGERRIGRKQK